MYLIEDLINAENRAMVKMLKRQQREMYLEAERLIAPIKAEIEEEKRQLLLLLC